MEGNLGLFVYKEDVVIWVFFDYGIDDCVNIEGDFGSYVGIIMEDVIIDLNNNYLVFNNWLIFMMDGMVYVVFGGSSFYNKIINGIMFVEWVSNVIVGI